MKAITIRNLPPEVSRVIRRAAKERRTSLNKTVISLLEDSISRPDESSTRALHHDLDHLAGSWTAKEADAFDAALAGQRQIDPELWK